MRPHQLPFEPLYEYMQQRGIRCIQIVSGMGSGCYHHAEAPLIENLSRKCDWFAYYGDDLPVQTYEQYAPFTPHGKWSFHDRRQHHFWDVPDYSSAFQELMGHPEAPISWFPPPKGIAPAGLLPEECKRFDGYHDWLAYGGAVGTSWFFHDQSTCELFLQCLSEPNGFVFSKAVIPEEWLREHLWLLSYERYHPIAAPHILIEFVPMEVQWQMPTLPLAVIRSNLGTIPRLGVENWPIPPRYLRPQTNNHAKP